ncbi:alcohol dehydrogenase [Caballeronia choica]|uniref:Alcohol dehydrogenase n=1 Tax=Caballeronia choica TaxID=326476 RepID=A0A158L302_9BURK|nr:NAD(P)-dependent alcohol dehydrogenase [Caballeronia choica]SAL87768.1 alcohol dehydrogenase [Caballeronia choica]
MKAVIHSRYGNPEVLQVMTLERPVPKKNEVLIRVKATGFDYGQWHLISGKPYAIRLATGLTKPKQRVLGMDVSGVVEAVGAEVTRFKVGDAVFGAASRTFAEFTCAREDQLCRKPARLSFEQAAASAISGVTALIGLRDVAKVKPGQSVCVIGAGGGVGSWAVQLARHFGAHVTAVCSTSKVEFVCSLGATSVIDYTKVLLPTDGRFDVILDLAGNRPLSALRKALAPRGTLVLGGGEGGDRFFGSMGRTLRGAMVDVPEAAAGDAGGFREAGTAAGARRNPRAARRDSRRRPHLPARGGSGRNVRAGVEPGAWQARPSRRWERATVASRGG